jgi:SAM-dependent methyltransferase
MAAGSTKADYGIDAPGVIRNLFVVGIVCVALYRFLPNVTVGGVTFLLSPMFRNTAIGCFAGGVLMLAYSLWMKFGHRDRMLSTVNWRGDERVLDVGTGAGLLLIGAAKKLTTGKATGVDLWSTVDLSGNTRERTLRNAEIEGVKDKVEVLDGDATQMKFADGTFDVVVSNLVIHNIPSREGRDKACREIARVLKTGGVAVISDFIKTRQYQSEFEKAGLKIAPETGMSWATFPPIRVIVAKKELN